MKTSRATHPGNSRHPFTEAEEYSFLSSPGNKLNRRHRTQRGIHMIQAKEYNFLSCVTKSHTQVAKTGEDSGKGIQLPVLLEKYSQHSCNHRCQRSTLRAVKRYPPALFHRASPENPRKITTSQKLKDNQK